MSYRLHILALLLLSGLPSTASAGFWEGGNPGGDELRGTFKGLSLHLSGNITGFKVTDQHGRTSTVVLASPQGLSVPLDLPAGEWTEITVLLDGPVTVRSAGQSHQLNWTLPEDLNLQTTSAERLSQALEDGGLAIP